MAIYVWLIFFTLIHPSKAGCAGGASECHWSPWKDWGSCSESCGGGYRSRKRPVCCDADLDFDQCMKACGMDADQSYGYGSCNEICYNSGHFHRDTKNEFIYGHCICTDKFGGTCCDEPLCGWDGRWCWPGSCYIDYERYCHCDQGFQKEKKGTKTMCQLVKKPTLQTCMAGLENANGDAVNTTGTGKCSEARSVYTNLQPFKLSFTIASSFAINVSSSPSKNRISSWMFGIVSNKIQLQKSDLKDNKRHLSSHYYNGVPECDTESSDTKPKRMTSCTGSISHRSTLQNGESLCVNFIPYAGGFMTTVDGHTETYKRTETSRELCFMYDKEAPVHCTGSSSCSASLLHINQRVTSNPLINVTFTSWKDPVPYGGSKTKASGIKKFVASFLRVEALDKTTLEMKYPGKSVTELPAHDNEVAFTLPTEPALYTVLLEVHDVAGNVQMARRFVLYDNSSKVAVLPSHQLISTTASAKTNYTWQVHHGSTCLNWTGRYYNTYHVNVNLLRKIKPDGNISSNYDQSDGLIPVSGTPNVDGIVRFEYTWKLDNGKYKAYSTVSDIYAQSFCENLTPTDGQTYTFQIKPVDINSRSITENLVVHIDRSPPSIDNIWVVKDGYRQLFVHNSSDLSKMSLQFEALDLHSGLFSIEWKLGTTDGLDDLGAGAVGVNRINESCSDVSCYCPKVGLCEEFLYTVGLNELVDKRTNKGQHNRNYYFSIIVTNNARLVNIEHLDILADDSSPEEGTIKEGVAGSPDIDYTSDPDIFVNWDGFIDHESGIKFYRVGISDKCLSRDDLETTDNSSDSALVIETTRNEWTFKIENDGYYISSVVAYNNAMEPSKVVCSDGITKDTTAPYIVNVTLKHSKVMEVIACDNSKPWLVRSDLKRSELSPTKTCIKRCLGNKFPYLINLPKVIINSSDYDTANHLCTNLPGMTENWFIYIPSNKIDVSWKSLDANSQIRREEVGIASDPSSMDSPDIEIYKDTHGHSRYHNIHEGIDRGIPFYLMVRTTNKAGLENILPLGPIIIDDTPPQIKGQLRVDIRTEDDKIFCWWLNDTFIDPEQKHAVDNILYRIGADGHFFTPLLQIPPEEKCMHDDFPYCIHYPISKLQRQDEEKSLNFYFELYVYNMAGHFTTVRSSYFTIPSQFRPGHGYVFDVDPTLLGLEQSDIYSNVLDYDVHFSVGKLCAIWTGFGHHKNVSFMVGVGTSENDVDVIPWKSEASTVRLVCFNSSKLEPYKRYFVTVNATCSGGSRIVSSDGVTIIDREQIKNAVGVNIGTICDSAHKIPLTRRIDNGSLVNFISDKPLIVGQGYTIESENVSVLSQVLSNDVLWIDNFDADENISRRRFRAFRQSVSFSVTGEVFPNITLLNCFENIRTSEKMDFLQVSVSLNKSISNLVTRYKASFFEDICSDDFKSNLTCLKENPESAISDTTSVFRTGKLSLLGGQAYRVGVSICFRRNCLPPVFSSKLFVQVEAPTTRRISAFAGQSKTGATCLDVEIDWEKFSCVGVQHISEKHEWALSLSQYADGLLTAWFPFVPDNDTFTSYKVRRCLDVRVYLHRQIFACIRTMCESGAISIACKEFDLPSPNTYTKQHVYELDANHPDVETIKQNLHAQYLGDILALLHKMDLDFCRKDTLLLGAIPNADERNITWYLLTDQNIPTRPCELSANCIKMVTSVGGHVTLYKTRLVPGKKFYICATSNRTVVNRELFDDVLDEISTCGNGFVVDDYPPQAGQVKITNQHNGFLNNPNEIHISWNGFTDKLSVSSSNTTSFVYSYSFALGSAPGGIDVAQYETAGLSNNVKVTGLSLRNGKRYYATVRAWDHVNLSVDAISPAVTVAFSPPSKGIVTVGSALRHKYVLATKMLQVHWSGFKDEESGIRHYYLGIGDEPGIDNILEFNEIESQFADLSRNTLQDGLTYYAVLKVVNNAGLWTKVSSDRFVLDSSPPVRGVVRDGSHLLSSDVDYQNFTSSLTCHWEAFEDPHSGIQVYRVGLGTYPGQFDIHVLTEVGLRTEFIWYNNIIAGEKYYATVEACNGAGLCARHHSDGIILDDSPPVPGKIHIGISGKHETYQSHINSISAHWVGFEDPQSDIHHFEWCLTLHRNACDVTPFTNILLSQSLFKTQLNLPLNTNLFIKVKAYNNVGMSAQTISDSFKVDNTHPVLETKPFFVLENMQISHRPNTQWENSLIRIKWKFSDPDSPLVKHVIRLNTHHDGKVRKENIQLGNEDQVTVKMLENDLLLDGDKYWATVTACNAAGLCTNSTSDDLLVDSSPPYLGGFKPPMAWQNEFNTSCLNLTWYGFSDVESGIEKYMLSVSRQYSGSELSGGVIALEPSSGLEQNCSIHLKEPLSDVDDIILSIWAINGVGLRSDIGKVTVTAVQTDTKGGKGILKLQKHSCVQHYCNRDCTCAVVGGKCEMKERNISCTTVKNESIYQNVEVLVGLRHHHQSVTASSSCLTSHWIPQKNKTYLQIQRYEWSLGINNPGDGVFDGPYTKEWFDVDLQTNMTFCMPDKLHLVHGENYTVFVKAWYSENEFKIFSSQQVTIDTTPPDIVRGKFITVSTVDCNSYMNFIKNVTTIRLCWQNVFKDKISGILKYYVMAGTFPYGDDLISVAEYGLETQATFYNLPMHPGTKYFFTIRAVNSVGLVTSLASDGIVLDIEPPFAGVVFNTDKHRNAQFHASSNYTSASWHGFGDQHSYIHHYSVWITEISTGSIVYTNENVGIRTSLEVNDTKLQHGERYRASVQAWDAAGYSSVVADSETFKVDTTPPLSFTCNKYAQIKSLDNFTVISDEIAFITFLQKDIFYKVFIAIDSLEYLSSLEVSFGFHSMVLPVVEKAVQKKESELRFLSPYKGNTTFKISFRDSAKISSVQIRVLECTDMKLEKTEFPIDVMQISHSLLSVCSRIIDPESGIKSVEVGVGTTEGGFQIHPLSSVPVDNHIVIEHRSPHGATLFVTAVAHNNAGLVADFSGMKLVVDHTSPEIRNLTAKLTLQESENSTQERLAEVTVKGYVQDRESGVKTCSCLLETLEMEGVLIATNETEAFVCVYHNFSVYHGMTLKPSIVCINNVELIKRQLAPELQASFLQPSSADAFVDVYPNNEAYPEVNEFYQTTNETIQSNRSIVYARWSGFHDVTAIEHYEYTLKAQSMVVSQHVEPDSRTAAVIKGLSLEDGFVYTLSVEAVNVGGVHSSPVSTQFRVESRNPPPSGSRVVVLIDEDGSRNIDWKNVFLSRSDMMIIYDINVGTREGYCDIIDRMETVETSAALPETESSSVWISVCARYVTGRESCVHQTLLT